MTSNDETEGLVRGLKTLKMIKGIVAGMMDLEPDYDNPFGFNKAIINYLKKYHDGKNVENYQLITPEQGWVLI
jgi:hypothetical protein